MGINYFYDSVNGLLQVVGSGDVSLEDRIVSVKRMLEDLSLPKQAHILINVDGITNAPGTNDFSKIAVLIDRLRTRFGGRVAIVNALTGHVTTSHLIAMSVLSEEDNVQVFSSEAMARAWLCS